MSYTRISVRLPRPPALYSTARQSVKAPSAGLAIPTLYLPERVKEATVLTDQNP
ncbi:hypothetical protein SAMN05444581_102175 [Methylocapsa palsarum]|uniref:Uncharacterized protein n=1 Tax=Methylocapsa palsarum TaxID=1612308 RepID=A0A1I3WUT0_9HYPH|nr:hypothetical protein SAMN05444581_102175 [Methylocapsa palsarum]